MTVPTLKNTVIDNVLCFMTTARKAEKASDIITVIKTFYANDAIKNAKKVLCEVAGENLSYRNKTVKCSEPIASDIEDMLDIIVKLEVNGGSTLPKFVAEDYKSLPPSGGFIALAEAINNMQKQITELTHEITALSEARQKDIKCFEDTMSIKEDINDIKIALNVVLVSTENGNDEGNPSSTSLGSHSNPNPQNNIPLNTEEIVQKKKKRKKKIAKKSDADEDSLSSDIKDSTPLTVKPRETTEEEKVSSIVKMTFAEAFKSTVGPFVKSPQLTKKEQDKEAFTLVSSKRAAKKNKKRNIYGNKDVNSEEVGFSGVPKVIDVFVGGCQTPCDTETIKEYCKKTATFNYLKCAIVKTKATHYCCFKLSVEADQEKTVLSANFWPKGIFVRRFRHYKIDYNPAAQGI